MPSAIKNLILKTIILTPGVVGLSNIEFTKNNKKLSEQKRLNGISIVELENNKYDISISIIVSKEINSKTVVYELDSSIMQLAKNNNIILKNLNIYIRGVE